ncbi:GNAT family N-acetyltransferase [Paenibacillus sp. NPDC058071]|uniref:GNAT family N-acetyltransferase n=1 Tax=Paenibacillus sp. NPDC058071 TaxID=3346326 RepID=UPI0036DF913B
MHIRMLEELSLNHWPPLSTLFYDGWALRFADGYTKRSNSISPIFGSTLDIEDKIDYCEKLYAEHGLPAIYKLTALAEPQDLDSLLEKKGYAVVDPTCIQTMPLSGIREPSRGTAEIESRPNAAWLDLYCRLNDVNAKHRGALVKMLDNLATKAGFITFYDQDRAVACGFGVIEREYVGLYGIVTDSAYRNQGFGEQMILHLLQWAKANGASRSYLAVVLRNAPAIRLYDKIGYKECYRYWYRVQPQSVE